MVQVDEPLVRAARHREQRAVRERDAGTRLELVHVVDPALLAGRDRHDAAVHLVHHVEERLELGALCESARDGLPVDAAVRDGEARREPGRAGEHRFAQDHLHALDLVGRCGALVRVVAHREETECGVTDVGRVVHRGAAPLHRGQVLGERREVPRDARHQ